jgi:hypothetical protein
LAWVATAVYPPRCVLTSPPARAISLPVLAIGPHPPLCLRVANGGTGAQRPSLATLTQIIGDIVDTIGETRSRAGAA